VRGVERRGGGRNGRRKSCKDLLRALLCVCAKVPRFRHRLFQLIAKLHSSINYDDDVKPDLTEHLAPYWTARTFRAWLGASLPAWPPSPSLSPLSVDATWYAGSIGSIKPWVPPHLQDWPLWTPEGYRKNPGQILEVLTLSIEPWSGRSPPFSPA